MRLLTYRIDDHVNVGVRDGDGLFPTRYRDMLDLIRAGSEGVRHAQEDASGAEQVKGEPEILAPVHPEKMFGCGINFAGHLDEVPDAKLPEEPFFFSKLPSALIGSEADIVLPYNDLKVDYEVELAVVIGAQAKRVQRAEAYDYVFGYTLANDVGSRELQFKESQITLGKNLDSFAPLGPEIVTADEIPDPSVLHIESHVNGELRQSASCATMRFDVGTVIEWLSSFVTLEPGDVITMGTPAGCGTFRSPPLWLEPGDRVEVSERTIGMLKNSVVAGETFDTSLEAIRDRAHRPAGV